VLGTFGKAILEDVGINQPFSFLPPAKNKFLKYPKTNILK
jgi:hypothetical protein